MNKNNLFYYCSPFFLQTDTVWLPKFDLVNADFTNDKRSKQLLYVSRLTQPKPDDITFALRGNII